MGYYAIPVLLLLGGLIVLVEVKRGKPKGPADFLTFVNIIYFLSFVLSPIFMMTYDMNLVPKWSWLMRVPKESSYYFIAAIYALLGYIGVLLGYAWGGKLKLRSAERRPMSKPPLLSFDIPDRTLLLCGLAIAFLGVGSFAVYTSVIGGPSKLFELAIVLRGGGNIFESKWMFLKNVSPLMMVASYFFYALMKQAGTVQMKRLGTLLFIVLFLLSLVLLFHRAGRMGLLSYLITFPVAQMLLSGRIRLRTVIFGGLFFLFITLFGKQLFNFFIYPEGLTNRVDSVTGNTNEALAMIISEFGFPFATLVNVMQSYPIVEPYHWFRDLFIGWVYILPDSLLGGYQPPITVSELNTRQFEQDGTIPIDLISFGYLNLGVAGIALATIGLGFVLALVDRLFGDMNRVASVIFRVAWMNFFAFRVMYSDPEMAFASSFSIGVGTALLLACALLTTKKSIKEIIPNHESNQSDEPDHGAKYGRRGNDAVPNRNTPRPEPV